MEGNLFRYILKNSLREQLLILLIVLFSFIFYFLSLDLPKMIVNQAIQGDGFPTPDSTVPFLRIVLPLPGMFGGGTLDILDGFPLDRMSFLIALSIAFLVLVIVNNAFKSRINTLKGRMGERMLRRLRYELLDRILRFPLPHFRKVKAAELATMIKDEVEPLGGFIGDAFVTPAFLGGQAVTAIFFIFVQNAWLGGIALASVVLQGTLIPRLRRRLLRLGRERQLTARQLAGRIAEVVDGIREVHANDTSNLERAEISSRLGRIFSIRFAIYQRKFLVKALNNIIAQLPPFVFYSIGGYFAIIGRLDIGALVAVIAAYKDVPSPLKELIDWDQQRLDVQIKYEQVIQQFQADRMIEAEWQTVGNGTVPPFTGPLTASNLSFTDDTGAKPVDGVSLTVRSDEHVAVVGPANSGKHELALILARLYLPTSGHLAVGSLDLTKAPETVTGRRIAYVGQDAYLFPLSVRDNMLYGLRHQPVRRHEYDPAEKKQREWETAEARRTGNIDLDIRDDWLDYDAAGVSGAEEMTGRLMELLHLVELEHDMYELGLRSVIDTERRPELAASALEARTALRQRLEDPAYASLVEVFDRERYTENATVAENLLFGTPVGDTFQIDQIAENPYVLRVLERTGLTEDFLQMGHKVASTMIELFAGLPPGHEFYDRFSFINAEDLPEFKELVRRADGEGLDRLPERDRMRLMTLPFKLIPAQHRLDIIDDTFREKMLAARQLFAEELPDEFGEAVEFYDVDTYNRSAPLQDNILFGKIAYGQARAGQQIAALIVETLDALGRRHDVMEAGLDYQVGVAGTRLSAAQRQKVAVVRALLKRPDILVVNEATATLDTATEHRLMERVLKERGGSAVIWVLQDAELARMFDTVLVMREGKLSETGAFESLAANGSALPEMLRA